jgi:hypothetical protein
MKLETEKSRENSGLVCSPQQWKRKIESKTILLGLDLFVTDGRILVSGSFIMGRHLSAPDSGS